MTTQPDLLSDPTGYTREELIAMGQAMRRVVEMVYPMLIRTNCHPFIEFCGLMSKYVDVCQRAAECNIPFPLASTHTEQSLPVFGHDVAYMVEKLDCIFGPIIRANPEARKQFAKLLEPG